MSAYPETSAIYLTRQLETPPEYIENKSQQYFVDAVDWLPEYILSKNSLVSHDPLWGDFEIGEREHDAVFLDILKTPAFIRLFDVEQLGLPRNGTTVPNTAILKRAIHSLGAALFTREMGDKMELNEYESMELQLQALLADLAHTIGSHEGDKMFQEGNSEDLHDLERPMYADKLEITRILRFHGFDPDKILSPKGENIVDADKPKLCADRIDYGLREIRRWIPYDEKLYTIGIDDFEVDEDGEIYMKDQAKATAFAKAFIELSREHWSEPIHRLQLEFYAMMIKRIQTTQFMPSSVWSGYHPRDLMYGTERIYNRAMELMTDDAYGSEINERLITVGTHERTVGWQARRIRVANRLGNDLYGTENPLEESMLGRYPSGISVETEDEYVEEESMVSIPLKELRVRQIDPKVMTITGKISRLSQVDKEFKEELERHKEEMSTRYIAKIAFARRDAKREFQHEMVLTNFTWEELLNNPRMPADVFKSFVRQSIASSTGRGIIRFDLSS